VSDQCPFENEIETVLLEARNATPALSIASANSTPTTPVDLSKPRTADSDGVKISNSGDRTRDTCTKLIYDALASDSGARKC
jgi:transcription elongation factor S-II